MKTKQIQIMFCMIMVFMFPLQSIADAISTDDWSMGGNYSIKWYNKNQNEFTLNTAKDLAGMAVIVNNDYDSFEGKTIKLGSDIDLSGKNWTPCKAFEGTFDGMGHAVSGVCIMIDTDDRQLEFGFWRSLGYKSTIKNLTIKGSAEVNVHKINFKDTFFGGIAGRALSRCSVENCNVIMDIRFSRYGEYGAGTENFDTWSYIGGIIGYSTVDAVIKECKHNGNIECVIPSESIGVQGIAIGGIAGRGDNIAYCENKSNVISLIDNSNSYRIRYIGGIAGVGWSRGTAPNILCCNSIIEKISIEQKPKPDQLGILLVGGIVCKKHPNEDSSNNHYKDYQKGATNCYSVIKKLELTSRNTSVYYGGIGSEETVSKSNFSNNDTEIDVTLNDYRMNLLYDGNTSFSFSQMQTPAFLEELNIYSLLEMDESVWKQDAEGNYPYIAAFVETTEGKDIIPDEEQKGDINGDGEVSGTDYVALTNMILGKSEKKASADLNGDGEVSGTDYVTLTNIILGKK